MQKIDYLVFVICLILSSIGAYSINFVGYHLGLIDSPNERSSHSNPTPKGGGIGILIVFIFVSFYVQMPLLFWLPVVFLSLISFYGDHVEILPKVRLPIQFIIATFFIAGISHLNLNKIYFIDFKVIRCFSVES